MEWYKWFVTPVFEELPGVTRPNIAVTRNPRGYPDKAQSWRNGAKISNMCYELGTRGAVFGVLN